MVQIRYSGQAFLKAIAKFEKDLLEEISGVVFETARLITTQAKAAAPVDDGSLRDSIEMEMLGKYNAIVRVGAHYAIYVEYGTGIYAKNGDGRKTPWTYYSLKLQQFVTTEGMEAQPFWFDAVETGQRYFKAEMRRLGL